MKNGKLWSILLVLTMIFSNLIASGSISYAASLEGEGTEAYPYLIKAIQDMDRMSDNPSAHYKLVNDLNYQNVKKNPLSEFKGVLHGNGRTISNLYIVSDVDYVGLFSKLNNAKVSNLKLKNVKVEAKDKTHVGTIAGNAVNSTISDCRIENLTMVGTSHIGGIVGYSEEGLKLINCHIKEGEISGSGSYTGGILGYGTGSKISQCYSISTIAGKDYVGGISGYVSGELSQCFSKNNIKGNNYVGGLIGSFNATAGGITDSFSQSPITAEGSSSYAGGLIAHISPSTPVIKRCYYSGIISAPNKYAVSSGGTYTNTYFDESITQLTNPSGLGRSTTEMYKKINYSGWDFDSVWGIQNEKGYPYLLYTIEKPITEPVDPTDADTMVVIELTEELLLSVNEDLLENQEMIWTSSNEEVAKISTKGLVSPLNIGETMITVTDYNGEYIEAIYVKVVEDASLYRLTVELKAEDICKVQIKGLDPAILNWSSMDPTVAKVTLKGRVKAKAAGLTVLTAVDNEGNKAGQVYIRVR